MEAKITQNLPVECDLLCDEYFMEGAFEVLQIARLEHLLVSGHDLETACEMSKLELDLRRKAYEAEDFVRSILGFPTYVEKNGDFSYELHLKLPDGF